MKRLCGVLVAFVVMITVCGCAQTSINKNTDISLTFIYEEENITVTLEDDEAEKVIAILNGNHYDPISYGHPSCGFDKNISLKVDGRSYAIARDACNRIQDLGNLRYFDISIENMEYIHSLFEKYGGYFPCV